MRLPWVGLSRCNFNEALKGLFEDSFARLPRAHLSKDNKNLAVSGFRAALASPSFIPSSEKMR